MDLISWNSLHLTTFLHSICSFFREEKIKSVVLKDILLYFYYDKKPVVFVVYLFYSFFFGVCQENELQLACQIIANKVVLLLLSFFIE